MTFSIDASGSIRLPLFQEMTALTTEIASLLPLDDMIKLGVQTFSSSPNVLFHLDRFTSRAEYLNALATPFFHNGMTLTNEALNNLRQRMYRSYNGDRRTATDVAVIITDGHSENLEETIQEARAGRVSGIFFIVILVGDINKDALIEARYIASRPHDMTIIQIHEREGLVSYADDVANVVCNGMFK